MKKVKEDSPYKIFHQIIGLNYCRTQRLLEDLGVYPGQPPLLFALHKEDGQSQKELSEKLEIQPATITVMVGRMTKAGLVERRKDSRDQRISRVYLTPKGKKIRKKTAEVVETIETEFFRNFSGEEKELLRELLLKMKGNLIHACDPNH